MPDLRKEKDKPKKQRKKTTSQLKKELDKIFSEFIRRKYADEKGEVKCYTCSKTMHWKQIHCGHFVSRSHLSTRFDESNTRPQCVGCNIFGGGKVATFGTNLEREGISISKLYRKAQQIVPQFPYEAKINYYKEKLLQL